MVALAPCTDEEVILLKENPSLFEILTQKNEKIKMQNLIADAVNQNKENAVNPFIERWNQSDENNETMNPLNKIARPFALSSFLKTGFCLPTLYNELSGYILKDWLFSSLYIVKLDKLYSKITSLDYKNGNELYLLHFYGSVADIYQVAGRNVSYDRKRTKSQINERDTTRSPLNERDTTRSPLKYNDPYNRSPLKYLESHDLTVDSVQSFSYLLKERALILEKNTAHHVKGHIEFYNEKNTDDHMEHSIWDQNEKKSNDHKVKQATQAMHEDSTQAIQENLTQEDSSQKGFNDSSDQSKTPQENSKDQQKMTDSVKIPLEPNS
ncbi:hypothetical protein M153_3380007005 [Pseudoloma neurophilia]|uniref:Uncharacterized protein n=1 Tax=Pseudoloma neurophilia TaxID=146866 RepID=A0A0R0M3W7_9MICR|nr:hypothetical protein M153_3380007005 [Pseudoloma neurophilia]